VGLDDVVLGLRARGPAVDGEVAVARGGEGAVEVDGSGRVAGIPGGLSVAGFELGIETKGKRGRGKLPYQPLPPKKLLQFFQFTEKLPLSPFW
jgi:hypothetical protein